MLDVIGSPASNRKVLVSTSQNFRMLIVSSSGALQLMGSLRFNSGADAARMTKAMMMPRPITPILLSLKSFQFLEKIRLYDLTLSMKSLRENITASPGDQGKRRLRRPPHCLGW